MSEREFQQSQPCSGWSATVVAVATLGLTSWGWSVPIPYGEDFNDAAEVLEESRSYTGASSTWTLTNNADQHTLVAPGSGNTQFGGAVVWGNQMEAPSDFSVQSTFNVSDVSGATGVARVGLVGLAFDKNVMGQWNNNAYYYAGEITVAGTGVGSLLIRYGRGQNSVGTLAGTSGTGGVVTLPAFSLNTTYTMTFTGDFNAAGDLTLSFSVDGTTLTAATIPAASFLAKSSPYFGIRDYTDNFRNLTVTYDDLVITNQIPEPATAGLMMLGGAVLASRRRRRR